jgi:hypothetical protein
MAQSAVSRYEKEALLILREELVGWHILEQLYLEHIAW